MIRAEKSPRQTNNPKRHGPILLKRVNLRITLISDLLGYTDRHHSPARQRQGSRAIEVILPVKSLFAFAQNRLSTSAWTPYN
jgi:hypothetical protein